MFSMLVHLNAISVTFEGQSRIDLAACEAEELHHDGQHLLLKWSMRPRVEFFLEFAILLLSILIPNQRLNDRSNTMLAVTQTEPLVGNETPQRIGVLKYDRTVTVQRRQGSALKRTR